MKTYRKTVLGIAVGLVLLASPHARAADFSCVPIDVAIFPERVHARCASPYRDGGSNIYWFSVSTADVQMANRFLNMANTALVAGKSLHFAFQNGDVSGAAWGCLAGNCRRVVWLSILH